MLFLRILLEFLPNDNWQQVGALVVGLDCNLIRNLIQMVIVLQVVQQRYDLQPHVLHCVLRFQLVSLFLTLVYLERQTDFGINQAECFVVNSK